MLRLSLSLSTLLRANRSLPRRHHHLLQLHTRGYWLHTQANDSCKYTHARTHARTHAYVPTCAKVNYSRLEVLRDTQLLPPSEYELEHDNRA